MILSNATRLQPDTLSSQESSGHATCPSVPLPIPGLGRLEYHLPDSSGTERGQPDCTITGTSLTLIKKKRPAFTAGRQVIESNQRRKASCRPPSTVMTWPVVLLNRSLTSRKYASAWSAGVIGDLVSVRSA